VPARQAGGPIENAIGRRTRRSEHHGLLPDYRSRRANEFLFCSLVKRALGPHASGSAKKNRGAHGGKRTETTTWNRSIRSTPSAWATEGPLSA
jgi:hypothetical protein